ncbi:MAG TPA: hypothetical protein VNZ26_25135 [Vicinamibacterales bacterium]|nr:hypothetical protein [Vicinamibacterales bacterium]
MRERRSLAIGLAVLALVVGSAATHAQRPTEHASPGAKKPWSEPRTPWGDPDIQAVWIYATMTPLERPRDLSTDVLTDEQAGKYEDDINARRAVTNNTAGPDWWDPGTRTLMNRRSSLIVDPPTGRIPPMTPDAQRRTAERAQARRARGAPDSPEDLGLNERCILWATAGPPMLPGPYNNTVQFIQTRDDVVIFNEMIHDARIVPMKGQPHGTVPQWMGDSRGHWDGHTLVVDTIDFSEKTGFRGSSDKLHVVERFTRVNADTLTYRFTVEDPATWTAPWTGELTMTRTNEPIYEYACHEGNYRSLAGIFSASRTDAQKGR